MSFPRHPPTLILSSLPKNSLVGIDLLSLTAAPRFQGFTALPPGWHFLFVSATTDLSSRQGIWFYVPGANHDDDSSSSDGRSVSHAGQKRQRTDSQPSGARGEVVAAAAVTPRPPPYASTAGGLGDADSAGEWLAVLAWDVDTEQLRPIEDAAEVERWRRKLLAGGEELKRALFPYRQSVPPVKPEDDDNARVEELNEEPEEDNTPALGNDDGGDGGGGGGSSGPGKAAMEPPRDFPSLASRISVATLNRICGEPLSLGPEGGFWTLDTGSASALEEESERIPGLEHDEAFLGRPLGLLNFDLKMTWPTDAVGRARTEAARDRSWKLGELAKEVAPSSIQSAILHKSTTMESTGASEIQDRENDSAEPVDSSWGSELLGEIQFCFLMAICLVNWSCLQQWKRMLELCLTCERAIKERPSFFTDLLSTLQVQLRHSTLVEGGLFDLEADGGEFLKRLLRRFRTVLGETSNDAENSSIQAVLAAFDLVRDTVREIWDWELNNDFVKQGLLQLEDGEMVEMETVEAEYEDEMGEYAPVVVEI